MVETRASRFPKKAKRSSVMPSLRLAFHQQRAIRHLKLATHGYTLHSWRRGSATADFLKPCCEAGGTPDATASLANTRIQGAQKLHLLKYAAVVKAAEGSRCIAGSGKKVPSSLCMGHNSIHRVASDCLRAATPLPGAMRSFRNAASELTREGITYFLLANFVVDLLKPIFL